MTQHPHPRTARLAALVSTTALSLGGLSLGGSAVPAASAGTTSPASAPTSTDRAAKPLRLMRVGVSCECGGAGYLWGWSGVGMQVKGMRDGFTYRVVVNRGSGPAVDAGYGFAFMSRSDHDFDFGRAYTFVVQERRGGKVVRTSEPVKYRIPVPVSHPEIAHLDVLSDGGQDYLVAGRTYSITYDGAWAESAQFAKGVDRVIGPGDAFTWYEDEGYAFPWTEHAPDAELSLAPTEDNIGQRWNIVVVGSRAIGTSRPGWEPDAPEPGSEWGHTWSVTILSEEQAAEIEAAAP